MNVQKMDYFKHLYEAASLNDVDRLDKLLEHEIVSKNLEDLLSKVCMELQLNCVHLTDHTKLILDRKLMNLRFFYQPSKSILTSQEICDRIGFAIKLIHNLYACEGNDELFILNLTFIAKQIFILKKILKSTYDRLPWEEIEFCVLTYIKTFKEQNEIVLFFRAILSKLSILSYLTNFGDHLVKLRKYVLKVKLQELSKFPNLKRNEVVHEIIDKYPEFKSLYNDFELLRDIYSLTIMLNYVELVESIEQEEKHLILSLMRTLQVIGEHLKNTLESPRLSQTTISFLLTSFSDNTRDTVIKLRNRLSHNQLPSQRQELLGSLDTDFLIGIKSDIAKIGGKISYILSKYKIKILRELGHKFLNTEDEEVMKEVAYVTRNFNIDSVFRRNISELKNNDVTRLKDLICQFHSKINLKSSYAEFLFASIDSILQKYPKENSVDYMTALAPFNNLYEKFYMLENSNNKSNFIRSLQLSMRQLLSNLSPQIEPSTLNHIVEMIISIYSLYSEEFENDEVSRLFLEIIFFAKFEANGTAWTEKFERKLGRKENKKEIFSTNVNEVLNIQKYEKFAQLREIFTGITYSEYKINKYLQAALEVLLLDLIPMLKYPNLKSKFFFFDENYPTMMGIDLRNHLAHHNVIIDVLLDSTTSVFLFVETLLKVEENQNFNFEDFRFYNISQVERAYYTSIDILNKKREMFTTMKENNVLLFRECLKKGADIRSRDINMSTCLHFAMNIPETRKLTTFLYKQGLSLKMRNIDGQTPLHIAALKKNQEDVEFLLHNFEFEVNGVDLFKRTASHLAALSGNEQVLNLFLSHGADLTKRDNMFFFPLQYAVMSGRKEVVEVFFKRNLFYKLNECFAGFTTLHIAAEYGLNKMAEYLLSKKLKVDARLDLGSTPLHLAVLNGHLEMVKVLIRLGADVNSCNINGNNAMHWACGTNREEIVKVLIKNGADINKTDQESLFAPIHYVTKNGFISILRILLANNANVNLATKWGMSPLYYAVKGRHLNVVEILLKQEEIEVNTPDKMGITPLHVAASNGDTEIASVLIKNGARVHCKNVDGVDPLHLASKYGHEAIVDLLIANHISVQSRTIDKKLLPLHLAAESGNNNIIKKLITEGSNINAITSNNSNCLHIAIKNERNIVDLLLHEGIKVDVKTKDNGFIPLHEAVLTNSLKIVETLLKAGSHIDAQDHLGNTPIHLSIERESSDIFLLLVENGANCSLKNHMGETPFLIAVRHNMIKFIQLGISSGLIDEEFIYEAMKTAIYEGNTNIVKFLLKQTEFDMTVYRDPEEHTLLHIAAIFGRGDSIQLLLNHGFGVDSRNKYGQTPLFLAAARGCEDILEILLENGAQINIQDSEGATPLHMVSIQNHSKCVEILLGQGADINIPDKGNRLALEDAVAAGHLELIKLFLKKNKNHLIRKGDQSFTLLHIAAQFGRLEVVQFLLSEGANMYSRNENESMPIHIAAREGFTEIINIFSEKEMNLDVRGKTKNSLLHYAASSGKINVLRYLLKRGCKINSVNDLGMTPLHTAITKGYKEVVEFLLNNAAIYNINHPIKELLEICTDVRITKMINSVVKLFSSIKASDVAKIEEVIGEGIPLNCIDMNKGSPLHFAVYKDNVEVVKILLRNKVWKNIVHKNGWTPLHYAVKYSCDKIVFLLLWHGARYDIDSDNGKKPVDFAENGSVRNLLRLINDCFEGVQRKDSNIVNRLKKIYDKDVVKAVMRAENKHGTTLITAAIKNKFPCIEEFEELFQDNVRIELMRAEYFIFREKYHEANEIYLSIYQKRRDIFGDDNPATLSIKREIAEVLYKLHLYKQALTSMEEIWQKLKETLGVDHERTLKTRSNMALILHRQGKNKESLQMFEEVHKIQKKMFPPEHNDSLNTMIDMASVLVSMSMWDEALKLNNAVLKIEENQFGPSNQRTMVTKNNIALIFRLQRKNEEALKLFQEVYETRKSTLGPYHSDTLRALHNRIKIFNHQEKYDDAFKGYKKLLKCQKKHLGHHHLDTLNTQYEMAEILFKQAKLFAAYKILKEIKDHKMAIQGANHPTVLSITRMMKFIVYNFRNVGVISNLDSLIEEVVSTMNKAAKRGDIDTIEKLLRGGVDVDEKDVEGRNSLHYAVDGNNIEVVKLLLKNDADITEKTNKGNTVLHIACNKGYQDIIELILNSVNVKKLGYLINTATSTGKMTALHIATKQGLYKIVQILLKKGAIYNCVNKDGKTPRDLAEDENVKYILQLTEDMFVAFKRGDFSMLSKLCKFEINDFLSVTNAKDLQNCTLLNLLILSGEIGLARDLTTKMNNVENNQT